LRLIVRTFHLLSDQVCYDCGVFNALFEKSFDSIPADKIEPIRNDNLEKHVRERIPLAEPAS
jgi:hypothetical protein